MRKLSGGRESLEPMWPGAWERPAACGPSTQAFLGQLCPLDPVNPQKPSKCSVGGAGFLGGSCWSSDHRRGSLPPLRGACRQQEATSYRTDWDNQDGLFLWDCIWCCWLSLEGSCITRALGLKKLWWQATDHYQGKTLHFCFALFLIYKSSSIKGFLSCKSQWTCRRGKTGENSGVGIGVGTHMLAVGLQASCSASLWTRVMDPTRQTWQRPTWCMGSVSLKANDWLLPFWNSVCF